MIKEIISQEVIEEFLNGSDPEKYIVGIEYEYKTNTIYKIIQDPEKGKIIRLINEIVKSVANTKFPTKV